jgi:hypothetical protein
MPKRDINYSNTIIYKIVCNDPTVTDVYVGHTTNFVQRKYAHKIACNNSNSVNHNCKVYQVIRNNGGWNNWKIVIVDCIKCYDHYEARKKEQEYFVLLNATLNSIEPLPQHRMKPTYSTLINKKNVTNITSFRFYCEKCNFKCTKQSIYNTHLDTAKHKRNSNTHTSLDITDPDFSVLPVQHDTGYICSYCPKSYKYHSGLWRHKSICSKNNEHTINNVDSDTYSDNETTLDEISQTENVIIRKIKKKEEITNKKLKHLTDENREIKMQMKMMLQLMTTNSQFQSHMMELIKTQVTSISHPPTQQPSEQPSQQP